MLTRAFDAVLCDVDGVIRFFDGDRVAALERAAGLGEGSTAAIGFAPENDLPLLLGRIGKAEWVDSIARGLAGRVTRARARGLAEAFADSPFRADEVVVGLLRRAREHCRVVLVTNATVWLDEDLALLGLTDLADEVVNSSRVGSAKPDRRIYEIAVERAGMAPERCLFVDDRQENVDAAVAMGMTGVRYRGPEDLRRALAPVLDRSVVQAMQTECEIVARLSDEPLGGVRVWVAGVGAPGEDRGDRTDPWERWRMAEQVGESRAELSSRLNWLRAAVLGANDGVVSTAGLVTGVAGAAGSRTALLAAGVAGLLAGAMSMAAGEYVSVSTQRDTERAALAQERRELAEDPEGELDELTDYYRGSGLTDGLAREVAMALTERDALAAHAQTELGIDPDVLTNPWEAALASAAAFTLGALVPLLAVLLPPESWRLQVTVAAVVAALTLSGWASARLGGAGPGRAVLRNVVGGLLAMAVTYSGGVLLEQVTG